MIGPIARIQCDMCASMVLKVTNCPCGCGVAFCDYCGNYYHIVARRKS
jgi:hypothetical protein